MLDRSTSVLARLVLVAALALAATLAGCGNGDPAADTHPVRTAADFDKYPCAVFTDLEISMAVAEPFNVLTGAGPVLSGRPRKDRNDDGTSCAYTFKPDNGNRTGPVQSLTVIIGRSKVGASQLDLCLQGAAARAQGYEGQPVGDKACTSPGRDLWMRLGEQHYHIVTMAQPGWKDEVEAVQATKIVSVTIARAAAERLPRT